MVRREEASVAELIDGSHMDAAHAARAGMIEDVRAILGQYAGSCCLDSRKNQDHKKK